MKRRDALAATAALLGGTIIGAEFFLSGCRQREGKPLLLSDDDLRLLDEVSETILPATPAMPGAKDAHVAAYMKTIVTDCYNEEEQKIFTKGLTQLNDFCKQKQGNDFLRLTADQRHEALVALDQEATRHGQQKKADDPNHYFTMIKQLTIWGFFSSEPGATKTLRYVPIPGRYEGCIDYHPGEGAWLY